jgi:hypothetical protein
MKEKDVERLLRDLVMHTLKESNGITCETHYLKIRAAHRSIEDKIEEIKEEILCQIKAVSLP